MMRHVPSTRLAVPNGHKPGLPGLYTSIMVYKEVLR